MSREANNIIQRQQAWFHNQLCESRTYFCRARYMLSFILGIFILNLSRLKAKFKKCSVNTGNLEEFYLVLGSIWQILALVVLPILARIDYSNITIVMCYCSYYFNILSAYDELGLCVFRFINVVHFFQVRNKLSSV